MTNYEHLLGVSEFTLSNWFKEITNQDEINLTREELFAFDTNYIAKKICLVRKEPEKVTDVMEWFKQEYKISEIDYIESMIDLFFLNKKAFNNFEN